MSLAYFRRRLAETQRWSEAPPAYRFHAATSNVDDDVLERSGEPFGAAYGETGFGTSEVLQELMSKDPKYVPISDLKTYQQGLVDTGYLPPGYVPTGEWTETDAAADRRASRDAFNTSRSGGAFGSASVQTLFRYLGYTVPTSVFDGMVGIAQGIVQDAATAVSNPVAIAEEGGFLGGAAVGAGIGATAGLIGGPLAPVTSTAGALIGGAIGGVAGFFGDLFDDDEDEDGDWNQIVGALSPIDEIRSGDAKHLFAALSTIMTASAVLKAAKVGVAGVQAAGGTKQLAMREGWKMAARDTVSPGILNQMTQAALKHRVWGSAAVGGALNAGQELATTGDVGQAFRDFGTGALIGAAGGKTLGKVGKVDDAAKAAIKALDAAPLARIQASNAGKVAQAIYTGAAAPTIVARGISEISGGETAVGEDIREADTASKLGTAGTVLDWTVGSLVFPSRLTPWKADDLVQGMKSMSSNHALLPFVNFARNEGTKTHGIQKTFDRVKEAMGRDPRTGEINETLLGARVNDSYLQFGIETRAEARVAERVATELPAPKNAFDRLSYEAKKVKMLEEERSALKGAIIEEVGGTGDVVGHSPTGQKLIEEAMSDPTAMTNFLSTKGFDFDYWAQHQEATEHLNEASRLFEDKAAKFTPAVKDEYLVAQDFERFGGVGDEVGEYEAAASRYVSARKLLEDAKAEVPREQLDRAVKDSGEELEGVLTEMNKKGIIDQDLFDTLKPGVGDPKVEKKLVDYLKDTARLRPRRNDELTEELAAKGLDRYMAVTTGESIIDYTHFVKQAEIKGLTEYGRRQSFFDSLSSLGTRVDAADIGKLRYNSIVRHLDKTAGETLKGMDGRAVADKIYNELKLRYDPDWLKANRGEGIDVRFNVVRRENEKGEVSRELFKIDPRDLDADDLIIALDLEAPGVLEEGVDVYDAANKIKRSLHVGAAFGADTAHPIATARSLGAAMKVTGLTGFNDFMRTANFVPTKLASKLPEKFKKGSYGYLPQRLRRVSMSLQFSLSPTFDASRYAEAAMFGKIRGGDIPIKAVTNPKKFVHEFEEGWVSPTTGRRVAGKEAVDEMIEFGDRALYGRAANKSFDELQLQLLNRGVLGFKPREVEYAQAWWLAQKKARKGPLEQADLDDIRETVMKIGQYGTKRTAIGNTAHFLFFPYLFSQKTVSAVVDFTLGAPTRNMLIHEGVRRWYEVSGEDGTSMSQDFAKYMEKHLPVAAELGRINNLAYGISPGRFFLEGMMDKDNEGKVIQGLTSFFLPGGVHSGIADTAGTAASLVGASETLNRIAPESLKHLFVPVIITDDGSGQATQPVLSLLERLVPAYRDIDRWFMDESQGEFGLVGAQVKALGKGAPRAQMSEYLDSKRVMGTALDQLATQQGYASWESLKSAQPQLAAVVDDIEGDLGQRFPDGARLANEFTNKDGIKEQALYDIAKKEDPTAAEEAINTIGMIEAQAKLVAAQTNRSQEEVLRSISPIIRSFAAGRTGDRQFMNLWDGLFRSYYGPIRQIEVA